MAARSSTVYQLIPHSVLDANYNQIGLARRQKPKNLVRIMETVNQCMLKTLAWNEAYPQKMETFSLYICLSAIWEEFSEKMGVQLTPGQVWALREAVQQLNASKDRVYFRDYQKGISATSVLQALSHWADQWQQHLEREGKVVQKPDLSGQIAYYKSEYPKGRFTEWESRPVWVDSSSSDGDSDERKS